MISSSSNPQIKYVMNLNKKGKIRKEEGLFIVEGLKMFLELPKERRVKIYVSQSFLSEPSHADLLKGCDCQVLEVSDEVFKVMSDTQTPQGILALVKQYNYTFEDLFQTLVPAHLMILETLQDPGNLGTIIRAGEGAGVTGIIMNTTTADIYNPKVIRATMGSIYRVPFLYTDNLEDTLARLTRKQVHLYAAHLDGKNNYEQEDYTGPTGFVIGNEANGLMGKTARLTDTYVKIPMSGQVESLNAAVAASVLMFETARQRRENS